MVELLASFDRANVRALAIFGCYMGLVSLLAAAIVRSLVRQYRAHSPAHAHPRKDKTWALQQQVNRRHVVLFALLAAVSLAFTWYYMFCFFQHSYRVWAARRGVHGGPVRLSAWLKDSSLFREAWGAALDSQARAWWTLQIFMLTVGWSVFMGKHGFRRRIPGLWMFMVLGQFVAISFAMNLFFLAVLVFPEAPVGSLEAGKQQQAAADTKERSPGPGAATGKRAIARRDSTDFARWTPPRFWFQAPVFVTYYIVLTVQMQRKRILANLIASHVAVFVPALLHQVVPASWGTVHSSQKEADGFYNRSLATVYLMMAFLVALETARVYLLLGPPFLEQSDIVIVALKGALYEHPAVSSVGWDVILCWSSIGAWAYTQISKH